MDNHFTDDLNGTAEVAATGGRGSVGSDRRLFAVGALVGVVFAAAAWLLGSLDAFSAADTFAGPRRGLATLGLVAAVSALIVGAAVACWAFMGTTRRLVLCGQGRWRSPTSSYSPRRPEAQPSGPAPLALATLLSATNSFTRLPTRATQ